MRINAVYSLSAIYLISNIQYVKHIHKMLTTYGHETLFLNKTLSLGLFGFAKLANASFKPPEASWQSTNSFRSQNFPTFSVKKSHRIMVTIGMVRWRKFSASAFFGQTMMNKHLWSVIKCCL